MKSKTLQRIVATVLSSLICFGSVLAINTKEVSAASNIFVRQMMRTGKNDDGSDILPPGYTKAQIDGQWQPDNAVPPLSYGVYTRWLPFLKNGNPDGVAELHNVSDGFLVYCLDQELNGHGVSATEAGWGSVLNSRPELREGLGRILAKSADLRGGINKITTDEDKTVDAATRLAIWSYLHDEGIGNNEGSHISNVSSRSGHNAAGMGSVELARYLYNEAYKTPSIAFNNTTPSWTYSNGTYSATVNMTVENMEGWYLEEVAGVSYSQASGENNGTFPITITTQNSSLANGSLTIQAYGYSRGTEKNLVFYDPQSPTDQHFVQYKDNTKYPVGRATVTPKASNGNIQITKSSSADNGLSAELPNLYSMNGAEFTIYNNSGTAVQTLTYSNGSVPLSMTLPAGTYTVKETKGPNSGAYINDPRTQTVTVEPAKTASVNFINTPKFDPISILLNKVGTNNVALADAEFTVKYFKDGSIDSVAAAEAATADKTWIWKTDANGRINPQTSTPLSGSSSLYRDGSNAVVFLPGTYLFTETKAPTGYLTGESWIGHMTISSFNGETQVWSAPTVSNEAVTGYITLSKIDNKTGKVPQGDATLEGAVYEVKNAAGEVVDTLTTDANGNAETKKGLPLGRYTIQETKASNGYLVDPTVHSVELVYKDQNTAVVTTAATSREQVKTGNYRIDKSRSGITQFLRPVAGVEFTLTLKSDPSVTYVRTTDEDGVAYWENIPYGNYIVSEKVPVWANDVEDFEIHLPANAVDGSTLDSDIINDVIQKFVKLVKVDAETGDAITQAGVTFKVKNLDTNEYVSFDVKYPKPMTIDTFETTEDGEFILPGMLEYGNYQMEEISAPEGYVLAEEPLLFTVNNELAVGDTIEVTFNNRPIRGRIEIQKSASDTKEPIEGVEFQIKDENGKVVDTLVTDENGKATSKSLRYGKYTVVESLRIVGYFDNTTETVALIVNDGVTVIVGVENIPTEVTISKSDLTNGKPVPGAKIEIYDEDGELVWEGVTDKNGETYIRAILEPDTKYTFKETIAPTGYLINEAEFTFVIREGNVIEGDTHITDDPTAAVIIKTDADNGDLVEGATYEVRDEDGNALSFVLEDGIYHFANQATSQSTTSLVTAKDGSITLRYIPVGTYSVVEIEAAPGYILSDEEYTLEVTETSGTEKPAKLSVTNKPIVVTITKTDLTSGKPVPGAKIEIYDEDGKLVYEGITPEDGKLVLSAVFSPGKYTFQETLPPTGYQINPETFEFEVFADGSVEGDTDITNELTKVTITKTDVTNGKPVPGATIVIKDKDGKVVYTSQTDENGVTVIEGLTPGEYTFYEEVHPEGYVLNTGSFNFTIDEMGEVTGITEFTNEPTELRITKVNEKKEPMKGVEFKLYFADGTAVRFNLVDGVYIANANGETDTLITDENGEVVVRYLPVSAKYKLVETKTHEGYKLAADVLVDITEENGVSSPATVKVVNRRVPETVVPIIGNFTSPGATVAAGLGMIALFATAFILGKKRKKNKADEA